jgi:glycerophosphoryl diester phosphodiesterase
MSATKRRVVANMEIIAHRGASYDAPENTLSSVNLAWQQQADAVEVDVHLSRDGRLVVIHDYGTRKTAGVRKKVSAQTLAELKELDVGRWKDRKWTGEKIATLEEVLAAVPDGKRLLVEIKCGPECLQEFVSVFRKSGKRPEQMVAIGFALETMTAIKQELREIEVCWIAEFKRNWRTGRWSPKPEILIEKAKTAKLDGLDLGARGPITRRFVEQVHDAGLTLYVWTVDSPAKARKLFEAGADGITTNRPGWLREQLW